MLWLRDIYKQISDDKEWFFTKLQFAFIWCSIMVVMIGQCNVCKYPVGLCRIYSFDFLSIPAIKPLVIALVIITAFFYVLEVSMLLVTFLLAFISGVIISYHESNGIFFRATGLTVIWAVQFLAYYRFYFNKEFDLKTYRLQYPVQIIAAIYTLAAISKLMGSGIDWINAGPFFSLQVIKNFSFQYFDTGSLYHLDKGKEIAYTLMRYKEVIRLMLAGALILELFCFAALYNRVLKFYWGVGLLLMHIGIAAFMGIGISVIAFPMVIFFINPLYIVWCGAESLNKRFAFFE